MNDTARKIIFYGGAAAILGLKVYGVLKGTLPWYMVIVLAGIGIITEPETLAAGTIADAQKAGYLPAQLQTAP